jgi:hypothetical protein
VSEGEREQTLEHLSTDSSSYERFFSRSQIAEEGGRATRLAVNAIAETASLAIATPNERRFVASGDDLRHVGRFDATKLTAGPGASIRPQTSAVVPCVTYSELET